MSTLSFSQQIQPFLWFNDNAEEAVMKYVGLFDNSRINGTTYFGKENPALEGSVLIMDFELNGGKFIAMNGGPNHNFTDAGSVLTHCKDQPEAAKFWEALVDDGGTAVA